MALHPKRDTLTHTHTDSQLHWKISGYTPYTCVYPGLHHCYRVSHRSWTRPLCPVRAYGSPHSRVLKRRLLPDLGTDRRCQGSGTLPLRTAHTSPYRRPQYADMPMPLCWKRPMLNIIMLKVCFHRPCRIFFFRVCHGFCPFSCAGCVYDEGSVWHQIWYHLDASEFF